MALTRMPRASAAVYRTGSPYFLTEQTAKVYTAHASASTSPGITPAMNCRPTEEPRATHLSLIHI